MRGHRALPGAGEYASPPEPGPILSASEGEEYEILLARVRFHGAAALIDRRPMVAFGGPDQRLRYTALREAAVEWARVMIDNVPHTPELAAALKKVASAEYYGERAICLNEAEEH